MARKMKLDFSGVESFQRASEGIHTCKIVSADMKQSQGGNDMIVVAYEVTKGDDKGSRVFENYPLVETALWKLKGMLQAIGIKADGKIQLDLDKLIGKVVQINVIHEEYEGKIRARVESVMKFKASASNDDDDEDDDLSSEDEDNEDEPEEKPAKKSKKKAPMNKPEPAEDEDDDEDDEDDDWDEEEDSEEEEKKPASKKKVASTKKKATASKKSSKKKQEEEDDDWDDDDEDWDEEE